MGIERILIMSTQDSRRSKLCDTCGDITVKNKTYRILLYILLGVIIGVVGFFSLYDFTDINLFLMVYPFVILGIIVFGVFLISAINRSQSDS